MARRLRIEPYDNDAIDADNDGIVQEGTAFERPAGTRLVDAVGNIIQNGITATQRAQGLRVVDRDGNTVPYTPTYGLADAATPTETIAGARSTLGTTLGQRYGTLGDRNPTLGARLGTLGERATPKRPDVTVNTPNTPDVTPNVTPETPVGTPAGRAYREAVTNAGGTAFTDIVDDHDTYLKMVEDAQQRGILGGQFRPAKSKQQLAEKLENQRDSIDRLLTEELGSTTISPSRRRQLETLQQRLQSGESIESIARDTARKYRAELDDEDTQVRIDFSSGILDSIIDSGGFISSSDTRAIGESSVGGEGSDRNKYETTLGIPPSLGSATRPVSSYVVAGSQHRNRNAEDIPNNPQAPHTNIDTDEAVRRVNMLGSYGDAYVVLKKDKIGDRTGVVNGDAPTKFGVPGRLNGDEDDAMNTLFNDVGTGLRGNNGDGSRLLDALAWGSDPQSTWEDLTRPDAIGNMNNTQKRGVTGNYQESLIFGGVTLEDIEEFSLPEGYDTPFVKIVPTPGEPINGFKIDGPSGPPATNRVGIRDYLLNNDEVLKYLSPEETTRLRERLTAGPPDIDNELWDAISNSGAHVSISHIARLQKRDEIRQRLNRMGFTGTVTFGTPGAVDLENPANPAFGQVAARNPATGADALAMLTAERLKTIL